MNITGFKVIGSTSTPRGKSDFVKTEVDFGDDNFLTLVCINGSDSFDFATSSLGTRTRIPCVSVVRIPGDRIAVVLWNAIDEPALDESMNVIRMVSRSGSTVGILDPPDFGVLASAVIRNWLFNTLLAQDAIAGSLLIEVKNATVDRLDYENVTEIQPASLVLLALCLVGAFAALLCLLCIPLTLYEVNTYNGLARAELQATFSVGDKDGAKLKLVDAPGQETKVYRWSRDDESESGVVATHGCGESDGDKNADDTCHFSIDDSDESSELSA